MRHSRLGRSFVRNLRTSEPRRQRACWTMFCTCSPRGSPLSARRHKVRHSAEKERVCRYRTERGWRAITPPQHHPTLASPDPPEHF
eukprot:51230-Prymnesium_polylepis.1